MPPGVGYPPGTAVPQPSAAQPAPAPAAPAPGGDLPLKAGPPASEAERVQRQQGWMSFFERMKTDPQLNQMVFAIGANLAQPISPGQTPAGHISNALVAGNQAGAQITGEQNTVAQQQIQNQRAEDKMAQDAALARERNETTLEAVGQTSGSVRQRGATRSVWQQSSASSRVKGSHGRAASGWRRRRRKRRARLQRRKLLRPDASSTRSASSLPSSSRRTPLRAR